MINMGIQWRFRYRLGYELALQYQISKAIILLCLLKIYLMKTVNGFKDVSIMSPQDEQWRRTSLLCFYTAIFLFVLSTTVCSQNINKQIVNIADENPTDYSFLSRYHYTKSKNYLKRRYRIRHWIPMFMRPKLLWFPSADQVVSFFSEEFIKFRDRALNLISICLIIAYR